MTVVYGFKQRRLAQLMRELPDRTLKEAIADGAGEIAVLTQLKPDGWETEVATINKTLTVLKAEAYRRGLYK